MSSTLPVAGFTLLDVPDLSAAIERLATTPCTIVHGVIEIWTLVE